MTAWRWIGVAAAVLLVAAAAVWLLRDPGLPPDSADGAYAHDCCGTLVLENGVMTLGGAKRVRYVVEEDEAGPYVLPPTFVGTWEQRGFQVDGSRPAAKLRLDTIPRPNTIVLTDVGMTHVFKRKASPLAGRR